MADVTHPTAAGPGIRALLVDQSVDETKGTTPVNGRVQYITIYTAWGTGTTSGVVTIETAPDVNYAGTWDSIDTHTWSAADLVEKTQITGAFGAIRTRISTVIGGGTITTYIAGA